MKRRAFLEAGRAPAGILCAALLALSPAACSPAKGKTYRNIGYVFQRGTDIEKLDVTKVTHINYSFGLIHNNEYLEVNPATGKPFGTPPNPDVRTPEPVPDGLLHTIYLPEKVASDLSRLDILRAKNPRLKVLLSVGGFDCRGFSDAAADAESRKAFAASCRETVDRYRLDGIDLDWEFPVIAGWGSIKGRPEDRENFTLLLREVRAAVGPGKLLTVAGSGNLEFVNRWTEFAAVVELLDFINIMTYDFQYGTSYYGSSLYASTAWPTELVADEYNCDKSVRYYIRNGCPPDKINLGLAIGAVVPDPVRRDAAAWAEIRRKLAAAGAPPYGFVGLKTVKDLLEDRNGFMKKWDPDARNMYISTVLADGREQFVLSYIEPRSIAEKAKFVKELGLGGIMFWEFGSDYDNSLVACIEAELRR
ncbi:MAG TPA: glycosyl hydrolase family 18 protein [Candidatus Aminicenantes bacterium]|nr:glycosyl hydrolase family 18 protein [Candidatus Aminicenantes bacterium]